VRQVNEKALRKARLSKISQIIFFFIHKRDSIDDQCAEIEEIVGKRDTQLAIAYQAKIKALHEEESSIIDNLLAKDQHDPIDSSVSNFQALCDLILEDLCKKYKVTKAQLKRYRVKVEQGKYPSLPYGAYDSLGGSVRTLISPRQDI
jgi:hypothetical protein